MSLECRWVCILMSQISEDLNIGTINACVVKPCVSAVHGNELLYECISVSCT